MKPGLHMQYFSFIKDKFGANQFSGDQDYLLNISILKKVILEEFLHNFANCYAFSYLLLQFEFLYALLCHHLSFVGSVMQ